MASSYAVDWNLLMQFSVDYLKCQEFSLTSPVAIVVLCEGDNEDNTRFLSRVQQSAGRKL